MRKSMKMVLTGAAVTVMILGAAAPAMAEEGQQNLNGPLGGAACEAAPQLCPSDQNKGPGVDPNERVKICDAVPEVCNPQGQGSGHRPERPPYQDL